MKDRRLTEFTDAEGDGGSADGAGDADERATSESRPSSDASEDATGDDSETVDPTDTGGPAGDPAVSTSRWDATGLACPACGSTVTRLWREDGRHVCGACKGW
ncbi:MAG: zinc ribbon domain-containing protein [Halovenus sp.]